VNIVPREGIWVLFGFLGGTLACFVFGDRFDQVAAAIRSPGPVATFTVLAMMLASVPPAVRKATT
jgi:hypothetical protein